MLNKLFRNIYLTRITFKRYRYKRKWAINSSEKTNSEHALNYFDVHYQNIFGKDWRSIRLALLSQPKHCALINNYCEDVDKILKDHEEINAFELVHSFSSNESEKYSLLKTTKDDQSLLDVQEIEWEPEHTPVTQVLSDTDKLKLKEIEQLNTVFRKSNVKVVEASSDYAAPHMLRATTFQEGIFSRFGSSKQDSNTKKLLYYLMDASSLLPVICMDFFPGCSVLDMCSAPGGKMMAMVQTMLPERIVCLDKSYTRMQRLKEIIRTYLPRLYVNDNIIETLVCNAEEYAGQFTGQFDRVLVDVPCFNDRHVLTQEESNLFIPNRRAERLNLPSIQQELLINGIKSCKKNGIIVYSTCTLSNLQNDQVIVGAIEQLEETDCEVVIEDTGNIARAYEHVYKFAETSRYGQLVLPNMLQNFGPMYFAKIRKLS